MPTSNTTTKQILDFIAAAGGQATKKSILDHFGEEEQANVESLLDAAVTNGDLELHNYTYSIA